MFNTFVLRSTYSFRSGLRSEFFFSGHQFVSPNLARKLGKIRLHFRDKTRLRIFSDTAAVGSCFIERMPAGTDFEAQTSFTTFQRLK